jgi:hypothetical protein
MTPFDICPNEINSHIVDFACSDGGITAQGLCLVSKYINLIASPFIWRSVSVSGIDRLEKLASRIEANPSLAGMIEDLFVSDWCDGMSKALFINEGRFDQIASDMPGVTSFAFYGRGTSDFYMPHRAGINRSIRRKEEKLYYLDESKRLLQVFGRIFPMVAPTVRNICLFCFNRCSGKNVVELLFSSPLPRLTELVISADGGLYDLPLGSTPSLTHIFSPKLPGEEIGDLFSECFSQHTQLRVWAHGYYDVEVVSASIRDAYHIPRTIPNDIRSTPFVPQSNLQVVYIDAPACPGPEHYDDASDGWVEHMEPLENLERLVGPVVLLKGQSEWSYTYARGTVDWRDRRTGGDGFWPAATRSVPQEM